MCIYIYTCHIYITYVNGRFLVFIGFICTESFGPCQAALKALNGSLTDEVPGVPGGEPSDRVGGFRVSMKPQTKAKN